MLIITRKKGESLMIGDDIEITISKLDDGSVKLGIEAPTRGCRCSARCSRSARRCRRSWWPPHRPRRRRGWRCGWCRARTRGASHRTGRKPRPARRGCGPASSPRRRCRRRRWCRRPPRRDRARRSCRRRRRPSPWCRRWRSWRRPARPRPR